MRSYCLWFGSPGSFLRWSSRYGVSGCYKANWWPVQFGKLFLKRHRAYAVILSIGRRPFSIYKTVSSRLRYSFLLFHSRCSIILHFLVKFMLHLRNSYSSHFEITTSIFSSINPLQGKSLSLVLDETLSIIISQHMRWIRTSIFHLIEQY